MPDARMWGAIQACATFAVTAVEIVCLLLGVSVAVSAISEITSRQNAIGIFAGEIGELQSMVVEATDSSAQTVSAESDGPGGPATVDRVRMEIGRLRRERSRLLDLIAFGATDARNTVMGIRTDFGERLEAVDHAIAALGDVSSNPAAMIRLDELKRERDMLLQHGPGSITHALLGAVGLNTTMLSTDSLLAVVVVICGILGSLIASIRADRALSLRPLALGLASGFIAFLAIKGGRHVFLLQTNGEIPMFNPYSCAFAALLTGLFTERAYKLLSSLVDQLAARIDGAFKGDWQKQEHQP